MRLRRNGRGSYSLPGTPYSIVDTGQDGPAGGRYRLWEIVRQGPHGGEVGDHEPAYTLREARETLARVVARDAAEEAERDKRTIRDESLPVEERRAAFRRHNMRHNPYYQRQAS